jgi:hypothetical protein
VGEIAVRYYYIKNACGGLPPFMGAAKGGQQHFTTAYKNSLAIVAQKTGQRALMIAVTFFEPLGNLLIRPTKK